MISTVLSGQLIVVSGSVLTIDYAQTLGESSVKLSME